MSEHNGPTMSQELAGWGAGLLIIGIGHLFIPMLAYEWGLVLIPLGVASLIVRKRFMFIVIGASLILVGLLNLVGTLAGGVGAWTAFGALQIYWGIKEIRKFSKYGAQDSATQIEEAEVIEDGVSMEGVKPS